MAELMAPWVTASVVVPLAAAAMARLASASRARTIGLIGCGTSLILSIEAVRELVAAGGTAMSKPWVPALFSASPLGAVTMALFAILALVTLISAPRRDSDSVSGILTLTAGALIAYGADSLIVFLAGWTVALIPFATRLRSELAISTGFLALGTILQAAGAPEFYTFSFLVLAAVVRTGLFPFHRTVVSRFETEPLGSTGLLMNTHLGIFLVVRFVIPMFPAPAQAVVPFLCALGLFTAIYAALLGMVEREPRRLLALVFLSQASAIFAGFVTSRPEGTMGGLIQWIVLGITSTVMVSIFRSIEARIRQPWATDGLLGLAAQMPRLAVFFAVTAFALVGLPGTLGFPGEDLLIHGVLSAHPVIGMLLPAAIAMNAYHLYRLFSRLFLGAPITAWAAAPDALPRERWTLAVCIVILVWGGLMPSQVVALRSTAGELIATLTTN